MPTVSERDLAGEPQACIQCPDYEGAIWLCGEGFVCERCFSALAGIDESELFDDDVALLDYEVPAEPKARVKTNLEKEHGPS